MANQQPQYLEYPYYTEPPTIYSWQQPPTRPTVPRPPSQPQPPRTPRPPNNIFNAEMIPKMFTAARVDARYKLNPIKPIVDSGASVSIITKALETKLKIKATEETNLTYCSIDGEEREVLGIAKNVPIMIEDTRTLVDLQIVTSFNDNLLLGMDWIKGHGVNLLFRTDKLELLDNGRPVKVSMTTTPAHVVHVVEKKPKAEINMAWNVDQFMVDVNNESETSYDVEQGYVQLSRSWADEVEEEIIVEELPSRWEEVNFVYRGEKLDPPCSWKSQNPKYYLQTQGCGEYQAHCHYYCKKCKLNFNPSGYWRKPKESSPCECPEYAQTTPPSEPPPPTQPHRPPTPPKGMKRTSEGRRNRPRSCYLCRRKDHKAAECPTKGKEPISDPDEEFQESAWDLRYRIPQRPIELITKPIIPVIKPKPTYSPLNT